MATSSASNLATTAARGTLLSILLRLASFLLSQLTVRFVSASTLGKASVPLELLLGTSLFVGREGFRLALTKELGHGDADNEESGNEGNKESKGESKESDIHEADGGASSGNGKTESAVNDGNRQQKSTSLNDDFYQINKQEVLKQLGITRKLFQKQRAQKIVNVSWLSIPAGALLSTLALLMHLYSCRQSSDGNGPEITGTEGVDQNNQTEYELLDYKISGILYCLASFVESLSEPLVIRCLQEMDVSTKAKAEGAALVFKAVSCFAFLYVTSCAWFVSLFGGIIGGVGKGFSLKEGEANFAVTAFGVSQLVYAMVFTSIMYQRGRGAQGGIRWPKWVTKQSSPENPYRDDNGTHATIKRHSAFVQNFDLHTLYLVLIFTMQGLLKHFLTEADKIVLSALAESYDQGVYALAASYGGLAARMLLQPLEENARLLFSRQGALLEQQINDAVGNETKKHDPKQNDEKETNDNNQSTPNLLQELEDTYCFVLRAVLYIGLLFAAVASNYTSLLLRLLAGYRWGSNPEASAALSAFCVYTMFLALNGTTEAFVYGTARSGKDVGKLSVAHSIIVAVFAIIAPGLVRRNGAVGLVAANCVCMALRSGYSLHYAMRYFQQASEKLQSSSSRSSVKMMGRITPHPLVVASFFLSFVVTRLSKDIFYDRPIAVGTSFVVPALKHVTVGASCVVVIVSLSFVLEKELKSSVLAWTKRKRE